MGAEQHQHDISDKAWETIKLYTIGEKGICGGNARDTPPVYQWCVLDFAHRGPWRDLPETYGN